MFAKQKKWGMMGLFVVMSFMMLRESYACKVLVVMKSPEDYFWNVENKRGIEKVLNTRCELTYVYLDVLGDAERIKSKAQAAAQLYQELQPDGVIVVEEDVQPVFVIPYLKDKVKTPVIFAGMFTDPATYGYPASNVTGVVHKTFFHESLTFLLQIAPAVKTVGITCNDDAAARGGVPVIRQTFLEAGMTVPEPIYVNDEMEQVRRVSELKNTTDALFVCPILGEKIVKSIMQTYGKPTFSAWRQGMVWGLLAGVVESGEDFGQKAAEMLLQVLDGTPITQLPITTIDIGHRVVNLETMKALGLQPSRRVLTGVELIKTK